MKLQLEPKHAKLCKGKVVQLKPCHMHGGAGPGVEIDIPLHRSVEKAIKKAHNAGKGYRLSLSEEEIEGAGLRSFFKKISKGAKKAFKAYKKHVVPVVGPVIRKGLTKAAETGLDTLSTLQPELAPGLQLLKPEVGNIVDQIGDRTGAFGDESLKQPHDVTISPRWDYHSSLVSPFHPAMQLASDRELLAAPGAFVFLPQGGSFSAIGGSFRRRR